MSNLMTYLYYPLWAVNVLKISNKENKQQRFMRRIGVEIKKAMYVKRSITWELTKSQEMSVDGKHVYGRRRCYTC